MHTLTDTKIRAASANGRTQRLLDGGGLYLEVSPTGSKWWRLKYRFDSKEKRLSLGTYPDTTLITDPQRVGALMRAIDAYEGTFPVRCALKLVPLTFVRSGELRFAAWAEIALDNALWRIPANRMKRTKAGKANGHLVPLSRQAVAVPRDLHPLAGKRSGKSSFALAR